MSRESVATIVIPCGPGENILDTLESVSKYCPEPHDVVIIDDCTTDGTYDALVSAKRDNWHVLRNRKPNKLQRIVETLSAAYRYVLDNLPGQIILKMDVDALIIGPNVITDAMNFQLENPRTGIFGVYETDYNRPRSYEVHKKLIDRQTSRWSTAAGLRPRWHYLLKTAESRGYRRGDNVFGGAYFITRNCINAIGQAGGLNIPQRWYSHMDEDVYFSMATVAAGYRMGHFAAPIGPLCLDWRGMPYPAAEMLRRGYKVVHSVDKGKNTAASDNNGRTARDIFREARRNE